MTTTEIKAQLNMEPFRPFAVRMGSGEVFQFLTPEDGALHKNGHVLYFFPDTGLTVRIDTSQIEAITSA